MSIELLQTMEWSKQCWDKSFEEIVDLDALLPKVGQIYPVNLWENEDYAKEGCAFLLWQPPHSELNGWDDKRPSEILKSYVLSGGLKRKTADGAAFNYEITDCTKLIDLFDKVSEKKQSPLSYIGQNDGSSTLQWQDAHGLLKAKIGGFLYLSGAECETTLEVILSYENKLFCLHYSATLHTPAQYETVVIKYYLNQEESIVFERLIDEAEEIQDNSKATLKENQVYGAEYW